MANSRLEKIGNIFTRVQGLLKSGGMKPEDRPIFFDIYKAFPPLKEPQYRGTIHSSAPIKQIFYPEDKERAERDDSTNLFNLNEFSGSGRRTVTSEFANKTPVPAAAESISSQPKSKIFDIKSLDDLKE